MLNLSRSVHLFNLRSKKKMFCVWRGCRKAQLIVMKSLSKLGKQLDFLGEKIRRTPVKERGRNEERDTTEGSGALLSQAESEEAREVLLRSLPASYFHVDFDALNHELKQLPANFEAASLESVVEERTTVLEVCVRICCICISSNRELLLCCS